MRKARANTPGGLGAAALLMLAVEAVEKGRRMPPPPLPWSARRVGGCRLQGLFLADRFWPKVLLFQIPMHCQLSDVVYQTKQFPLGINLDSPTVAEPIKAQVAANVCEHRLDRAHPAAVVVTPAVGVESFDHAPGSRLSRIHNGDVSHLGLLPTDAL